RNISFHQHASDNDPSYPSWQFHNGTAHLRNAFPLSFSDLGGGYYWVSGTTKPRRQNEFFGARVRRIARAPQIPSPVPLRLSPCKQQKFFSAIFTSRGHYLMRRDE